MKRKFIFLSALLAITVFYCNSEKYFVDNYKPIYRKLAVDVVPETYFIRNFPHISFGNAYCNSTCIMMVDRVINGSTESVHYYNWLTGFTYGASYFGTVYSFGPYTDIELGNDFASPFLNLQRNYYVCDDSTEFINNLKELISDNEAVRVALNSAIYGSQDKRKFWPHSVMLVGYDENNFIYYETGRIDRDTINSQGEIMKASTLIEAEYDFAKRFGLPWKYNFTTFTKVEKVESSEKYVWERNGEQLIGRSIPFTSIGTGSEAILGLAESIRDDGIDLKQQGYLKTWIKTAEYTRADNANFLKSFSNSDKIILAAEYLEDSGENYNKIIQLLNKVNINEQMSNEIGNLLENSSKLEKSAGELMMEYALTFD